MPESAVEQMRRILQAKRVEPVRGRPTPARGPAVGGAPDNRELIAAVNMLYSRLRRFDDWLRDELGLNLAELHVLALLSPAPTHGKGGPRSAAAHLAKQVNLSPGGLTRLVDRLVERGLVVRVSDSCDKRITHLLLTDAGLAMREVILRQAAVRIRGTCWNESALLEQLNLMSAPEGR